MAKQPRIDRALGRAVFGRDPEGYDRARPGYPDELYRLLAGRCGLAAGSRVLEIGPGTGQATRRLVELGAVVTAVEPDPVLAAFLAAKLAAVDVRNAAFEEALLEPGSFDLVTAATSFHWVEPGIGLGRAFEALRPGGWCALWWNVFGDWARPDPFVPATDHLWAAAGLDDSSAPSLRYERDLRARVADLEAAGFEDARADELRWTATLAPGELRARRRRTRRSARSTRSGAPRCSTASSASRATGSAVGSSGRSSRSCTPRAGRSRDAARRRAA